MKLHCVPALLVAIGAVSLSSLPSAAEEPTRDSAAGKPVFVPFDFYPRHREELGLTDEQVREMQRLADQMRDSALTLDEERRERTRALQQAMAQDPIDPAKAMELFQSVLKAENEMKALQFRNGLAMRSLLTPPQIAKLLPLVTKDKASGIAATSGVLDEKLQQLRAEIRERSVAGEPSSDVVARVEEIERAAAQGRVAEARAQIDALLRELRSGAGSGALADVKRPGKMLLPKYEEARSISGEDLKKKMRAIGDAAKRTDNPKLRVRFESALRSLQEAADSGDQGAIEKIIKSVEPALQDSIGEIKGKE